MKANLVDGARQADYGDPVEFFRKLSAAWSAQTGTEITPRQACRMMQTFKLLRLGFRLKQDSADDFAGYLHIEELLTASDEESGILSA